MATQPKPIIKARTRRKPAPVADSLPAGTPAELPIDQLDPSPYNPRRQFPDAEIEELAASVRAHGLLQRIVVRPVGQRHEIVAGERRYRAALQAGLPRVPVEIRQLDDAAARELAVLENLQRKDLDPIEEAAGLRAILEGDGAPTQAELGRRLGKSQPYVANRLRLLKLPKPVQARVISGEIPATHARELCRVPGPPEFVGQVVEDFFRYRDKGESLPPADDFADDLFGSVESVGRRLEGSQWDPKHDRNVPFFTPTPAQREKLGIVEIPGFPRNGKIIEVATNAKLWDKLQTQFAASYEPKKNGKAKAEAKAKPAAERTPAEKKAARAEEARKAKERRAQFERRLADWRVDWQRYLIAQELLHNRGVTQFSEILLAAGWQWHPPGETIADLLGDLLGCKKRRYARPPVFRKLVECADVDDVVARACARLFWDEAEGPCKQVWPEDIETVFDFLGLDLERAWLNDQAGPLSDAYWNLHDKQQLADLSEELLGERPPATAKKSTMVAALLAKRPKPEDKEVGLPLPKELRAPAKRKKASR